MSTAHDLVEGTFRSVEQLRVNLGKNRTQLRVRSQEERALVQATALAWFNNGRKKLLEYQLDEGLDEIDTIFRLLLERTDHEGLRKVYLSDLTKLKSILSRLRSLALTAAAKPTILTGGNEPPDFTPLVPDARMKEILARRWNETILCLQAGADLAATVMMGGLLEGLLLARLNLMNDKAPAFKATAAPKDKSGATLPLKDWVLKNYIEVAHELRWIGKAGKDVGNVLRDYRNYIHPAKELSHGITVSSKDTQVLWPVFVTLSRQVLASAKSI